VLVSHISGALLCSLSRSLASTHSGMHGAGTHRRRSAADVCAAAFSASPITCRIFYFCARACAECTRVCVRACMRGDASILAATR
jgi:hypothetical protein